MGEVGSESPDPTVLLADADVLIDYRESELVRCHSRACALECREVKAVEHLMYSLSPGTRVTAGRAR